MYIYSFRLDAKCHGHTYNAVINTIVVSDLPTISTDPRRSLMAANAGKVAWNVVVTMVFQNSGLSWDPKILRRKFGIYPKTAGVYSLYFRFKLQFLRMR